MGSDRVYLNEAELTDEEWIALKKEQAKAECERCRGREFGDCDSACRYWPLTASATEILMEKIRGAGGDGAEAKPFDVWIGPRFEFPDKLMLLARRVRVLELQGDLE